DGGGPHGRRDRRRDRARMPPHRPLLVRRPAHGAHARAGAVRAGEGVAMSRIEPIERPANLFTRFAYWMMKRQLGKVMTPAKVVYARMPKSLVLATTEVWV